MTSQQISLRQLFSSLKKYLVVIAIFIFYLFTIPHMVILFTPCLQRLPGQTYEHKECIITLALDRFMLLALLGFAILILYLFFTIYPRSLKRIILTALIMSVTIILAYFQYIPKSEREIKKAPVILYSPK